MKRFITFIFFVLSLCMLSGCVCFEDVYELHEDGSLVITQFNGLTPARAELYFADGYPSDNVVTAVYDGTNWVGEYDVYHLDSYAEAEVTGAVITKNGDSYTLRIDNAEILEVLREEAGARDAEELFAMMAGAYVSQVFEFPLPVTQTGGPSEGVEVDGNTLSFNVLKAQPAVYTFYAGQGGQFTDVSNQAWYYSAVAAMRDGGLVNGYDNGNFGPGDNITLSAICTILARVDGVDVTATAGEYWAKKAIDYCVAQGYINPQGDSTSENYDRYATREEVTAAISRAYAGFNAEGGFKADIDDKAGAVKNIGMGEDTLRKLYDKTGYCAYIMTNPEAEVDFQKVYADVFGEATNGVVVVLNYNGDEVTNESVAYYSNHNPGKAHIAGLFDGDPDPIMSLLNNLDSVKGCTENWKDVAIPDADQIAADYLGDIKVAYKVGLCSGSDAAGTFNPKANITRAEVCQLFYNINWTAPGVS